MISICCVVGTCSRSLWLWGGCRLRVPEWALPYACLCWELCDVPCEVQSCTHGAGVAVRLVSVLEFARAIPMGVCISAQHHAALGQH